MTHTQTVTLNEDDNPFILYLDDAGVWQLRIAPRLAGDREKVRAAIVALNWMTTTWFCQTYGLMMPAPGGQ